MSRLLSHDMIQPDPFPHIVLDGFIDPHQYRMLAHSFPDITWTSEMGRTGYEMYRGDRAYDDWMALYANWARLHFQLCRQAFVDNVCAPFNEHMPDGLSAFDWPFRTEIQFADFVETRDMLCSKQPIPPAPREKVFVRMDIQCAYAGYSKPPHLDHRRRVASMLLYFCDQDECGMEGGELVLHRPDGTPVKQIEPRHNRAVLWPQVRTSYHSVNEIVRTEKPRKFLYVAISSRVPVWPKTPKAIRGR